MDKWIQPIQNEKHQTLIGIRSLNTFEYKYGLNNDRLTKTKIKYMFACSKTLNIEMYAFSNVPAISNVATFRSKCRGEKST